MVSLLSFGYVSLLAWLANLNVTEASWQVPNVKYKSFAISLQLHRPFSPLFLPAPLVAQILGYNMLKNLLIVMGHLDLTFTK